MFSLNAAESQPSGNNQETTDIVGTMQVNFENVTDFSNVCRTCATITELVIPIFTGDGIQNGLADKIHKHLPIKVTENDVLPQVVCYQCVSTLMAWHELVKCCVQADQALRSRIEVETRVESKTLLTSQGSGSNVEEDTKSRFPAALPDAVRPPPTRAPPLYTSPLQRCNYCDLKLPMPNYNKHLLDQHHRSVIYSEECNNYKDKREFFKHMNDHATDMTSKIERQIMVEMLKKNSQSNPDRTIPKSEVVEVKQSTQTIKDRKPVKTNIENEFSDHSDTENGFGPLPESVFEAIEDSQDNQSSDNVNQTQEEENNVDVENKLDPQTQEEPSVKGKKKTRICPICSKVYTASSSFFYHMRYTHKRIKEHECSVCMTKFATRASLASHMTTHSGECRYECVECHKRFRSNASLYIHEQTHTGVKTWSCSECPQAFRWRANLLRHMQRHSAEKAHVCITCGRGFSIRCDLLRHARTHTAGNFTCDKCDVKFAQMRYLKVHISKKHSESVTNGVNEG